MSIITHSDGKVKLNIMQDSPLDRRKDAWKADAAGAEAKLQHWVPSRYNVRATADDGRLVLWNTLTGAMSVFKAEEAPQLLAVLKSKGTESRKEGLVGYLADRGFLVPKDTNEYRRLLLAFGQQHYRSDRLELILMPSEDCNFRCKYCYEDFARGTMLPEVRQGIKRLVEQRIENLSSLGISWFGGEPMYGWEAIEELGPFFADITAKHGMFYRSHMTTNGYLLTPPAVEKLFAWKIDNFQITIDGTPENHDCNRPARDGSGTFWTIFENLVSMSKRPDEFFVGLRVNFDKTNSERMGELFELLEKHLQGDERFVLHFHAVGRWGGQNDSELEVCGTAEKRQLMDEMHAAARRRGLKVANLRHATKVGTRVCYAARPYNFLVGASGQVMKCTVALDKDDRNVVGKVTSEGELVLDDYKMAAWTEPAFERDTQCQKCVVSPICQGISCPLPRITHDTRSCIPARKEGKSQLLEVLALTQDKARTRQIPSDG